MQFKELELGTEFYTERYGKEHSVMKINELEVWDKKDNLAFQVSPDLEVSIVSEVPMDTEPTDEDMISKSLDVVENGRTRAIEDIIEDLKK